MSDDPVKKMNKKIAELFLRHEIERNRVVIDELTEALKRDVIDETRNAELNNAKDAAIAELVGMLKICATRLEFANKHIDCEDEIAIVNAAISKYDNTTEKRK